MTGPLTRATATLLIEAVSKLDEGASIVDLERVLRLMAKWRSQAMAVTQIGLHGGIVQGGLFAGMDYSVGASEGSRMARLLGAYEASLQPHLLRIVSSGVDTLIDIGCAEGYYAVGMARRFPELAVHAYDINPLARESCQALAEANGVADRVAISGEFEPTDFEAFADRKVLVIVDAEGAELDVLRPDLSPALSRMSLVVETHDVWRPGALAELTARFEPTHAITRVEQVHETGHLPDWLMNLSELDQLLAVWEWRHRPTPWLVMEPR